MASFLRKIPVYLLLLPVFFVLHGFRENLGQIPFGDAAVLTLYYFAAVLVVAAIIYFFFRDIRKTAFITGILFASYLFFGALQDFLKAYMPFDFFSRYRVMLPALLLIFVGAIIYCARTKRKLFRLTFFFNLLFVIYISVEIFSILFKTVNDGDKNQTALAIDNQPLTTCSDCKKPDIWLLVFDSYAGSASLEDYHHFHNPMDSFLLQKGFNIQRHSRSNYNLTPFSMASILNMSYLEGMDQPMQLKTENYLTCNTLIRTNLLSRYLEREGYEIVNYSIFDLPHKPTLAKRSFLPLKTNLIRAGTLYARLERDMGEWLFFRFPFKYFTTHPFVAIDKTNHRFLDLTKKEAAEKNESPRFVYMHTYMPHRPYFFDRQGNRKTDTTVIREFREKNTRAYLDYMLYTNKKVEELINAIQQNDPDAVIIFMGDHGHRIKRKGTMQEHFFANMNAVYFPDRDYKGFYDSISGVNQFRTILNKLFRQSIPLLKDSVTLVAPAGQKL